MSGNKGANIDIAEIIEIQLKWFGNLNSMPESRWPNKIWIGVVSPQIRNEEEELAPSGERMPKLMTSKGIQEDDA